MRGAQGTWKKKEKKKNRRRRTRSAILSSNVLLPNVHNANFASLPLPTADTRLPLVPKWSSNEMPSLFVASFSNDQTILAECPRHTVDKALKAGLNWNERKFFKGTTISWVMESWLYTLLDISLLLPCDLGQNEFTFDLLLTCLSLEYNLRIIFVVTSPVRSLRILWDLRSNNILNFFSQEIVN